MNLLLLLTALLTSLTGMVAGTRAEAAPMSVVRADVLVDQETASLARIRLSHRPAAPAPRLVRSVSVPVSQSLAASRRPVPERRRE